MAREILLNKYESKLQSGPRSVSGGSVQRAASVSRAAALACMLAFAISCTSVPRYARPGDFADVGPEFSGEIVEAHRDALRGLGPRWPGSQSDEIARAYLAGGFRSHGARARRASGGVSEGAIGHAHAIHAGREHFIAEISGNSDDVVLLVATYPVLGSSSWIDDTGAAVLLELARVFEATRPAYGLRFALAEVRPSARGLAADAPETSGVGAWEPVESVDAARRLVVNAGRSLAARIRDEGGTDHIRAIIVLDLSADAQFRFSRDLRSHPGFRELFWDSAARRGQQAMFPRGADWAASGRLQLGFREAGVDRILALVSDRTPAPVRGGAMRAGSTAGPSTEELTSFGRVIADALNQLMRRFEKVDAFSR